MTRPAHAAFLQDLPHRGLGTSCLQASKSLGSLLATPLKIHQALKQGANSARATCLLGWVSKLRQGRKGMLPTSRRGLPCPRACAFKLNRSESKSKGVLRTCKWMRFQGGFVLGIPLESVSPTKIYTVSQSYCPSSDSLSVPAPAAHCRLASASMEPHVCASWHPNPLLDALEALMRCVFSCSEPS